jgi:hypothetical protein
MIVSELAMTWEGIRQLHQISDPGTTKHRTKMIISRSSIGLISKKRNSETLGSIPHPVSRAGSRQGHYFS